MANRHDDRERGRYEDRGFGGDRYGRESHRGSRSEYDRERNFGGGRRDFNEGSMGSSRTYGSYSGGDGSDYEEGGSFGRELGESYRSEGEGYRDDRGGNFGGQYGSDYGSRLGGSSREGSRGRRRQDRGDYGGNYFGYGGAGYYGSDYPQTERGYFSDRGGRGGDDRGWLDRASDEVSSWFGDDEAARRRQMDSRESGQHRGRGPRNYTRSDDRILEDLNDELTDSWSLDASDIEVEVISGDVTLTGTVKSRYEKRLAEDIAEDVSGVKNVENRLRVQSTTGESNLSYSETNTTADTEVSTQRSRTAGGNQ